MDLSKLVSDRNWPNSKHAVMNFCSASPAMLWDLDMRSNIILGQEAIEKKVLLSKFKS